MAPKYIQDLVSWYQPSRNLRSTNTLQLKNVRVNLMSCGERAFCKAAPTLWNALPDNIKEAESVDTFKSKLKTHLFKEYFYNHKKSFYS